jgi:haloalkane dehalogenase
VIPDWVDRAEYPFEPHRLDVGAGTLSYVDEGEGGPVVMVHGTPTWSFLYRRLVKGLRARHRCVVPDHLGFGLSDKPADFSYAPADQAGNLTRLIETLALKDITLVVHDFGGPIGLSYAIEHPENVRRLVLFNTWMWSLREDRRTARAAKLFAGPLGRFLYARGFSVNVLWKHAIKDPGRYSGAVHEQYARAMASPPARHATLMYARALLGATDWYDGLWRRRDRLAGIPALLVWGMKDPAFGAHLPRWREVFPAARVAEFDDTGHAPQETRAPEVLPIIRSFLEETSP